jgi:O-acetylhomoserine/O-acetylserine sulfhydrylase-like pyridoxal-dependent enzyme
LSVILCDHLHVDHTDYPSIKQDPIKKKYFRILPDQKVPQGHAYSKGAIKRKEEDERLSDMNLKLKKQCLANVSDQRSMIIKF